MKKEYFKFNSEKSVVYGVIILSLFAILISLGLTISNRRYLFIEKGFKNVSSYVNNFFVNNMYSRYKYNSNVITSKIEYLVKENNRLKESVNLKENKNNYIISEVINRNDSVWSNKLNINKGYKNNIKKYMPVINQEGLVGFIGKTSKRQSEVRLIKGIKTSDMLSVIIESENTEVMGILSSYDNKKGLFKITNVNGKNNVKKGDKVLLSEYVNDLYGGIYVGKVYYEESSEYGLNKTLWVKSDVNFDDLLFLTVVSDKWYLK